MYRSLCCAENTVHRSLKSGLNLCPLIAHSFFPTCLRTTRKKGYRLESELSVPCTNSSYQQSNHNSQCKSLSLIFRHKRKSEVWGAFHLPFLKGEGLDKAQRIYLQSLSYNSITLQLKLNKTHMGQCLHMSLLGDMKYAQTAVCSIAGLEQHFYS